MQTIPLLFSSLDVASLTDVWEAGSCTIFLCKFEFKIKIDETFFKFKDLKNKTCSELKYVLRKKKYLAYLYYLFLISSSQEPHVFAKFYKDPFSRSV